MITQIRGRLVEKNPTYVVVDCAGVGYLLHVSLQTYSSLPTDENIRLFTHLSPTINPHNSSVHACHAFEAFLLCKDLKTHRKNPPKGVPKWSPTEVTGGSKSMAGAMF